MLRSESLRFTRLLCAATFGFDGIRIGKGALIQSFELKLLLTEHCMKSFQSIYGFIFVRPEHCHPVHYFTN